MNSFQVTNKEGIAITINQLDNEAATFWNKEVHLKAYACPTETIYSTNWYDCIGWAIANQNNYTTGWKNVLNYMINIQVEGMFIDKSNDKVDTVFAPERLRTTLEYLQPYVDLINHWHQKGYIPVKIEK